MSGEAPVLILGFNRPDLTKKVFQSLHSSKPRTILFAVDGPRAHVKEDKAKVDEVQKVAETINWPARIEIRFRSANLGLKDAVVDAVTWAISNYGRVIVVEDDLLPGKNFLQFMNWGMETFQDNHKIGHVSGYNIVPSNQIKNYNSAFRYSIYPESYAWGTWERAWVKYADRLDYSEQTFKNLNLLERYVWKTNFKLAEGELLSTWAYRWINSLWKNDLLCVSPNQNISTYLGFRDGTHTVRKKIFNQIPLTSFGNFDFNPNLNIDFVADKWISQHIFNARVRNIPEIIITNPALRILRLIR